MYTKPFLKKRLAVDIPIELHEHLRYIAKKRRCTISQWVIKHLELMAQVERVMAMNLWSSNDEDKSMQGL